jgi:integrase
MHMPLARKVPSYTLHSASGRAVVRLDGKDFYLGLFGSPESHERYARLIAEWLAASPRKQEAAAKAPSTHGARTLPTVAEALLRYKAFCQAYYVKEGRPTKELVSIRYAMRTLRELYGSVNMAEIGPLALKALQVHLVGTEICRNQVNARINRIKRFFKWAVSEELAPPSCYEGLRTVAGLRYGRTAARESPPVRPVADEYVEAILPHLSPQVHAMVRLQRLTGMRPCEVVQMRRADIDQSGSVWVYEPADHKNRWRGHRRLIALGPKSQEILAPFLDRPARAYLFSPAEAESQRNSARRQARQTPMTPSQAKRRPKPKPQRAKRQRYDVDSYRRAIKYAIAQANRNREPDQHIPDWFPLQLRHSLATEIRKRHGLEAAQVALGHARADVTQVYAEKNLSLAIELAPQHS